MHIHSFTHSLRHSLSWDYRFSWINRKCTWHELWDLRCILNNWDWRIDDYLIEHCYIIWGKIVIYLWYDQSQSVQTWCENPLLVSDNKLVWPWTWHSFSREKNTGLHIILLRPGDVCPCCPSSFGTLQLALSDDSLDKTKQKPTKWIWLLSLTYSHKKEKPPGKWVLTQKSVYPTHDPSSRPTLVSLKEGKSGKLLLILWVYAFFHC